MNDAQHPVKFRNSKYNLLELNDKYFYAFNDSKDKKKILDCQTLPEKYFGLPEFSTRRYQILQMGGRSPSLHPCFLRLWLNPNKHNYFNKLFGFKNVLFSNSHPFYLASQRLDCFNLHEIVLIL